MHGRWLPAVSDPSLDLVLEGRKAGGRDRVAISWTAQLGLAAIDRPRHVAFAIAISRAL